jgi:hypothetical protein
MEIKLFTTQFFRIQFWEAEFVHAGRAVNGVSIEIVVIGLIQRWWPILADAFSYISVGWCIRVKTEKTESS